jgi:formate hydrogenlyase subunit 4
MTDTVIHLMLAFLMPPLLPGIITRTKAAFAGRTGAPLLQPYRDLFRLMRKGSVFSSTTSWLFRAGPVVTLAATAVAALVIPLGNHAAPLSFTGDMLLFVYLFGLARFFTLLAALDTGSSFEGMGAARDATFSCLAEPTLFFALLALGRMGGALSLSPLLTHSSAASWLEDGAAMLLLSGGLFIVLLAENCRVPFDDPTTHLELTMVHEVMLLDHSGPLFGFAEYAASLKLFVLGTFLIHVVVPVRAATPFADWGVFIISMILLSVVIGTAESVMARLRILRIPQMLVAASIMAAFAVLLIMR